MPVIVSRDGQPIHYRVIGRGAPVLMLHGVGMDSRHWLPFILPLVHRFRFYLPDFRGAGKASLVAVNQADLFQNLAEDIQDLMNHLDLSQIKLVGYSLGASIALHLHREGEFHRVQNYLHIDQSPCISNQSDWPYGLLGGGQTAFLERLRQLHAVLQNHEANQMVRDLPSVDRKRVAALLGELLGVAAGNQSVVFLLRQAGKYPRLFARLIGDISMHNLCAYLQTYFANPHDYRKDMVLNETAMTMFIGAKSPLYQAEGQKAFADTIPNCRTLIFQKSGHLPQADEPLKFGKELARFLKAAV